MSSTNRGTVSVGQDLMLIGPDDLTVPLTADLHYSCQDPYAIRMSLDAGRAEPVVWNFSRDLLAVALYTPEGIGDVRAWPSMAPAASAGAAGTGEKILNIELGPPDAYARFEADAAGIEAFLARTYELVPDGQEPAFLDLDAELTELLSQA
jgi:Streptomyces sporulation and cell division protein, SsgA